MPCNELELNEDRLEILEVSLPQKTNMKKLNPSKGGGGGRGGGEGILSCLSAYLLLRSTP